MIEQENLATNRPDRPVRVPVREIKSYSISRRDFIGLSIKGIGAGIAFDWSLGLFDRDQSSPVNPQPIPSFELYREPTITQPLEPLGSPNSAGMLQLDQDGMPRKFYHPFDLEIDSLNETVDLSELKPRWHDIPYGKVIEARNMALKSQEPELVLVYPFGADPQNSFPFYPQTESFNSEEEFNSAHPDTESLSGDVLSDEELAKRGVSIISSGFVKLFIRASAFAEDGPLYGHKNQANPLTIVLVDGPIIKSSLDDPRYDLVRDILPDAIKEIDTAKKQNLDELAKNLEMQRRQLSTALRSSNVLQAYDIRQQILQTKIQQYLLNNVYSFEDMTYFSREFAGEYIQRATLADGSVSSVVFATVSNGTYLGLYPAIYYTETGQPQAYDFEKDVELLPTAIERHQAYPNPDYYHIDPNASRDIFRSYPIGAQSVGFVLRHEISHDLLISQRHPSDDNEYDTDMEAYSQIKKAHDKWVSSGYKDDSGYCYIFTGNSELTDPIGTKYVPT